MDTNNIRVGCSGFAGSMKSYPELFDIVEVQHTFYQPPQLKTLERWRADVDRSFEFDIKAWQLITHTSKSPTYRRLTRKLSQDELKQTGSFSNTPIVHEAWKATLECAEKLAARRILFQCPASFRPTEANLDNMRNFFNDIERNEALLFFEPRGAAWTPPLVKQLCAELDIFHAVDPFVSETQTPNETYFRLHGKTGWRYVYSGEDLSELLSKIPTDGTARVFFNNISMRDDALLFISKLKERTGCQPRNLVHQNKNLSRN